MLKYIFLAIMIILTILHVPSIYLIVLYTISSIYTALCAIMMLGIGSELISKPKNYLDKNERFCLELINLMAEHKNAYKFNVIAFTLAHIFISAAIYHLMIPAALIIIANLIMYFAISNVCTRIGEL